MPTLEALLNDIRNYPRRSLILQMGKELIDTAQDDLTTKKSLWKTELDKAENKRDPFIQELPRLWKSHRKAVKELKKALDKYQSLDQDLASMMTNLSSSTGKTVEMKKKMVVAQLMLDIMTIVTWEDHAPFKVPPSSNEEDDDNSDDLDEDDMEYSINKEEKEAKKNKLPDHLAAAAQYEELSDDNHLQVVKDHLELHSFSNCTLLGRAEVLGVLHIMDCFSFHKSKFFRGLFKIPPVRVSYRLQL